MQPLLITYIYLRNRILTATHVTQVILNPLSFFLQLHEAKLDKEDQTQTIQSLKKKVQKLSNEAQDFKLQLEDSLQHNTELEKRQRK